MLHKSLKQQENSLDSAHLSAVYQVLIVSDDNFSVHGMVSLFGDKRDKYEVTVANPDDFFSAHLIEPCPDVILINSSLYEHSFEKLIGGIHELCAVSNILLFGHEMSDEFIFQAMRAGARGYLNEKMRGDHLVTAIVTVINGGYWAERHIMSQFLSDKSMHDRVDDKIALLHARLTSRESEVLELVLEGLSTSDIAEKIHLSNQGVKAHLTNLFHKFEVKTRVQLILSALNEISPVNNLAKIAGKGLRAARSQSKKAVALAD